MAMLLVSYVQQGCTKVKPNKQAVRLVLMDNFKMRMGRDPANFVLLVSMNLALDPMSAMLALLASITVIRGKSRKVLVKSVKLDVKRRIRAPMLARTVVPVTTKMKPNKQAASLAKKGNLKVILGKLHVFLVMLANSKILLLKLLVKLAPMENIKCMSSNNLV